MIIISACHAKLLVIHVELNHETEEVESIFLDCFWDIDAAEVSFMRETRPTFPLFPNLNVATPQVEAVESIIQNIHYVVVVLLIIVSRRVEIHCVGDSREKNDKDGAPVAAKKNTSNYSPYEREGTTEIYGRVVRQ